jgi:hypothetical protein
MRRRRVNQHAWMRPSVRTIACFLLLLLSGTVAARAQHDLLRCHWAATGSASRSKRALVVTRGQWAAVKRVLLSRDPSRIGFLISSTKGVGVRPTFSTIPGEPKTEQVPRREFLSRISTSACSTYEALLGVLGQRHYERRVSRDNWEVGFREPDTGSRDPQARIIFGCEEGKLKIRLIATRIQLD